MERFRKGKNWKLCTETNYNIESAKYSEIFSTNKFIQDNMYSHSNIFSKSNFFWTHSKLITILFYFFSILTSLVVVEDIKTAKYLQLNSIYQCWMEYALIIEKQFFVLKFIMTCSHLIWPYTFLSVLFYLNQSATYFLLICLTFGQSNLITHQLHLYPYINWSTFTRKQKITIKW